MRLLSPSDPARAAERVERQCSKLLHQSFSWNQTSRAPVLGAMSEKETLEYLRQIVSESPHGGDYDWGADLPDGYIIVEPTYTTIEFSNSGAGEGYVLEAFQAKWPDRRIEMEVEGGCDTCGYGQRVTITIDGATPPWDDQ